VLLQRADQLVSPFGGHTILDQIAWSFVFGTLGFLLLRLLARIFFTDVVLGPIAGATAIAAFPIGALLLGLADPGCCIRNNKLVLFLELLAVLTCAGLFLRKRFAGLWMIMALTSHFLLWALVTSSYVNVLELLRVLRSSAYYHPWPRTFASLSMAMIFYFGFPVIGLLASVIWVVCVSAFGMVKPRRSRELSVPGIVSGSLK
jgi:hypothetical protein